MKNMESRQNEDGGATHKDPYHEVIKKPEHNGRLRLFGKGVTRATLKDKGTKCDYIFPQEFLQSVQMQVVKNLQQANPNLDIVIPEIVGGSFLKNPTSEAHQFNETTGRLDCNATESPNHVSLLLHLMMVSLSLMHTSTCIPMVWWYSLLASLTNTTFGVFSFKFSMSINLC